jgi:hypothetical protein
VGTNSEGLKRNGRGERKVEEEEEDIPKETTATSYFPILLNE